MRVLDLFCGVGGASEGYVRAGYEVVGMDIKPQPNYPYHFIHGNAMEINPLIFNFFDLIHASPPCQAFSWGARKGRTEKFPDYISEVRQMLEGHPFVIENIPTAPLLDPVMLCGTMFDLPLLKHRHFETSFPVDPPEHQKHIYRGVMDGHYLTVAGHGGNNKTGNFKISAWQKAMDMPWAKSQAELAEAIPPAYTKFIGEMYLRHLTYPQGE